MLRPEVDSDPEYSAKRSRRNGRNAIRGLSDRVAREDGRQRGSERRKGRFYD